MLAHVLVPLDGSALSEEALSYARQIVDPHGKLTLVTAVELPVVMPDTLYPVYSLSFERMHGDTPGTGFYTPEHLLSNARTYLEHVVDRLHDVTDIQINIQAEISEPAELIIKKARELRVDAITMSTHGHSGFTRWLFGSVTTKVLNAAPCPVFVIPSNELLEKAKTSTSEMYIG
jgi:nucleotide-binding universal stress UspA family protein